MSCIHKRYGNLNDAYGRTDSRCHLCWGEMDVANYGHVRLLGRGAGTMDHLVPQSEGGADDWWNLLPAHHGCNAARGTQQVEVARELLSGTTRAPSSQEERLGLSVLVGGAAFALGGELFASTRPDGTRKFNYGAAAISGLLAAVATHENT